MAEKDTITTKFRVDISDLKKGITEANNQIKLANAQFKAASAGMDNWASSTEGIKAKLNELKSVLEAQNSKLKNYEEQLKRTESAYSSNGQKIADLKTKLQQLADQGIAKTSDEYKKYEKALSDAEKEQNSNKNSIDNLKVTILNQKAAVGETEKEMRKYDSALEDVEKQSKAVGTASDTTKKGIKEVGDESEKSESKISKLAKSLASGLAKAAIAGATAAAGLVTAAINAANTADNIDKMSQKIGISREAYQELDFALSQSGASVDDLQTGMKTLVNQMQSASEGTASASAIFDRLGISITDANGDLRNQEDVLFDTLNALQNMTNETEKAALASDLFGRSGTELLPLLNSESESIEAMRQQAHDLGIVMSDEFVDNGVELKDSLDQTKRAFSAITAGLAGSLMPIVTKVSEYIQTKLPDIQALVKKLEPVIDNLLEKILPPLMDLVETLLPPLIDLIVAIMPVLDPLLNLVMTLLRPLLEILEVVLPGLAKVIETVIVPAIDWLAERISEGITNKINEAKAKIQSFKDAFESVINWIRNAWQDLGNFFNNAFGKTGEWFKGIKESISDIFKNLLNGVIDAINKVISVPLDAINKILQKLHDIKILGLTPFDWIKTFQVPQIPKLAKGGVLDSGARAVIAGENGAEAVVPLEKNKYWISKVADEMMKQFKSSNGSVGGNLTNTNTNNFTQIINAPKQPSRIELYRQTKNLLNLKGAY